MLHFLFACHLFLSIYWVSLFLFLYKTLKKRKQGFKNDNYFLIKERKTNESAKRQQLLSFNYKKTQLLYSWNLFKLGSNNKIWFENIKIESLIAQGEKDKNFEDDERSRRAITVHRGFVKWCWRRISRCWWRCWFIFFFKILIISIFYFNPQFWS